MWQEVDRSSAKKYNTCTAILLVSVFCYFIASAVMSKHTEGG